VVRTARPVHAHVVVVSVVRHATDPPHFDAAVVGAGVSGLYQLHRLRTAGRTARVYEAGADVGGTWYWNRYPGARFDSESYTYGYSFSPDLLRDWEWSEHFAGQPETLRYLNAVADRFDLRRDIQFDTRVLAAAYDPAARRWHITLEDGTSSTARFLITAIGALSVPVVPAIDGAGSFGGPAFHTADWPREPVDLSGRVAVIGTGATGIQLIQEVAKVAGRLIVFQRTPNWAAPLGNSPIGTREQREIKASYDEIFARCGETYGAFIHDSDRRKALEVPVEERLALFEKLYAEPGFGIWMANFRDLLVDETANATISAFMADKIRSRVHDPAVADALVPRDHGFGTRRLPLESGYFEVYNQDNVRLLDLRRTPIVRITPSGIRTRDGDRETDHAVDVIVFATGFDAVTGAFEKIDIRGEGGRRLVDEWAGGPRTFLGMQVAGFPNLFMIGGPHSAATFCNMPRCIEQQVDWITTLVEHMGAAGRTVAVPTEAAQREWTRHVYDAASRMLFTKVDSWFTGVNTNLSRPRGRTVLIYAGGAPAYRQRCDEVAANGYEGLALG
jgi:cation diffusion facilitator CzcD-associated flavoprotein CzcO